MIATRDGRSETAKTLAALTYELVDHVEKENTEIYQFRVEITAAVERTVRVVEPAQDEGPDSTMILKFDDWNHAGVVGVVVYAVVAVVV